MHLILLGESSAYQSPSGQITRMGPRSLSLNQFTLFRRKISSGRAVFSGFSSRTTIFSSFQLCDSRAILQHLASMALYLNVRLRG